MRKGRVRRKEVREFIVSHVEKHPGDIGRLTARQFGITRQAVNKHLQALSAEQVLIGSGQTRSRIYKLASLFQWRHVYRIVPELAEDIVWRNDIKSLLHILPENVLNIWHYGFTEMFNNAMDHSSGSEIVVSIIKTAASTEMLITDNGVGIFRKIQSDLNLLDERHALLELSKGKLTTAPQRHSGEGIFFSSRMFDSYEISSGGVCFSHDAGVPEERLFEQEPFSGTRVLMRLRNHVSRTTKKIFDQYTSGEDYGFNKTVVSVRLIQYENDQLISRSQAKRLLARVELFKFVIFDFKGVKSIGQAFADEIFRVFSLQHPDIKLEFIHATDEVKKMIGRTRSQTGG